MFSAERSKQETTSRLQRARRGGAARKLLTLVLFALVVGCGQSGGRGGQSGTAAQALAALAYLSDWGTGYCASVTVTNDGAEAASSWTVLIAMNQSTLNNLWSALPSTSGDQLTVTPESWNAALAAGASTSFGFCASAPGSSHRPTITAVTFSYPGSGTGGAPSATGGSGGSTTGGMPTGGAGGPSTSGGTAPGESFLVSISVPPLVKVDQIALAASQRLALADRAQIQSTATGMPAVVSLGTEGAELGAGAHAFDVYARHAATLRSNAHLLGSLFTAGTVTRQDGTVIDGLLVEDYTFDPLNTTSWTVTFPATSSGDVMLEPDQPALALYPGRYGKVSVKSRSRLVMSAGDYYFDELHVLEPQSELLLDDSDGPIRLHVRQALTTRGKLLGVDGARPRPLIIVTGSSTLFLEATFSGFLVAPQAEVWLRTTTAPHRGAIFARTIHLDPDVVLEHEPFEHGDFYGGWLVAGDHGDLRWGWQASWAMGDTFPDNPDYGDTHPDGEPRHEECAPGLELVQSIDPSDGVTHRTELRHRTTPTQRPCVVQYRECDGDAAPSSPLEAILNELPGAEDVCLGAPDRFPCTIDESTIEWDDDLGLCSSDADCLLFGKVCAVVCQRVGCTGSPDCIDPTCSSSSTAASVEVMRCAAPSLESCTAIPTETHCQVRNECPEPDAVGTAAENPGSDTARVEDVSFTVEPAAVPVAPYIEADNPCYNGAVYVGPPPNDRVPPNIASGNAKWGLKIEPTVDYRAEVVPRRLAGGAVLDVSANAQLDAKILVWGKEVSVLEARIRGQLRECETSFTKTFKVFGFDVVGGGEPVAGRLDDACDIEAPTIATQYSALGRSAIAVTDLLQVADCYGEFNPRGPEGDATRWRQLCQELSYLPSGAAAIGYEGVDCQSNPEEVVDRLIDLYAAELGALRSTLDFVGGARQALANELELLQDRGKLEVLTQSHPFNVADIAMSYPVGPVTVSIQIELGGAWGITGTLSGEYAIAPDTYVRAEGGLNPYAETTVIVYAGVGIGPVTVGVSGELLLFRIDVPVTAYAEARRSEQDDLRPPPSVFAGIDDLVMAFPAKEYDWEMGWGLGAGATTELLSGNINLEARLRLGPIKKSIKKQLAEWTGLEKEYVFVSAGERRGSDGSLEFPSATGDAALSTVRSDFYFVDAEYLRAHGVEWRGDPATCPPPPTFNECEILR